MRRRSLLPLVAAAALAAAGCQTAVLHGLSEKDTTEVIAALQEQGIMASKEADNAEAGTWKVVVPRREASRVWTVLQDYRLPRRSAPDVQKTFGNSLIPGPLQEKALYLESLQAKIAHTLESVPGVVSAGVIVATPDVDLSGQSAGEARASVALEYHPDPSGRAPLREDEVKGFVANGVTDLKPEKVSVVMKPIQLVRPQRTYDFVAFGPIVVAAPSVAAFKILTGGIVAIVLALGASLYWSGRVISELRERLLEAQRPPQAIPKPPKPAA